MSIEQPKRIAKEYESVDDFNTDTEKVFSGETTGMYTRYDYKELADREEKFAEMIGVPDTAIFNSGMAAIHTALEAESLKSGDIVLCSREVYSVTLDSVEGLKKRGIKVEYFDPSNIEELEKLLEKLKPSLIVAETVANSKEMPVVDIETYVDLVEKTDQKYKEELTPEVVLDKFFSTTNKVAEVSGSIKEEVVRLIAEFESSNNPLIFRDVIRKFESETGLSRREAIELIAKAAKYTHKISREGLSMIIDNTLPSPVLINPIEQTKDRDLDLTVVESGTKHYQDGKNEITMGIVYSQDGDKMKQIKDLRVQNGAYLQSNSEAAIPENITEIMEGKLKNHARNALQLAKVLEGFGITVFHPNLETHKQSELVQEIAPEGAVTLFYIDIPNRDKFMEELKNIAGDKIGLGSSFGHSKTWLSNFGVDGKTIRIAVGSDVEEKFEETISIFSQAVKNSSTK